MLSTYVVSPSNAETRPHRPAAHVHQTFFLEHYSNISKATTSIAALKHSLSLSSISARQRLKLKPKLHLPTRAER